MDIPTLAAGPRRIRAFTLLELMIALATLSILLAVGVPGFRAWSGNSAVAAGVNSMASHLHLARSEAIKRGSQVILCPSQDGSECLDSYHWQDGFIIFDDRDGNRLHGPQEPILRYHRPDPRRLEIKTSVGRKRLVYQASGMSPGSTATITVCDRNRVAEPRAIVISNAGRPRLSLLRPDGSALNCD